MLRLWRPLSLVAAARFCWSARFWPVQLKQLLGRLLPARPRTCLPILDPSRHATRLLIFQAFIGRKLGLVVAAAADWLLFLWLAWQLP